jgi:hypothetical protein
VRRPALLVALLGAGAAFLLRRSRAAADERQLWAEATSAPDLR